ncbi:MAG TPA: hypothetical protein VGL86_01300 [Polyangia bacterium]
MRGVAALDSWLDGHRDVAGFVVWEPVLGSDEAAPAAGKRARRARNYWDASRQVSAAMLRAGGDPACLASGDADLPVVWDALFDYAPGATTPAACGRTILRALPSLR